MIPCGTLQLCTSVIVGSIFGNMLSFQQLPALSKAAQQPSHLSGKPVTHVVLDQRHFSILATAQNLAMSTGCKEKVLIGNQYTLLHPGRAWYLSYVQPPTKGYIQKAPQTSYRMHGGRRARQPDRTSQFYYTNVTAGHKVKTKLCFLFSILETLPVSLEALTRFVQLGEKDFPAGFSQASA